MLHMIKSKKHIKTLCTVIALCTSIPANAQSVTVGGYTQQQLEQTYYLDRDYGSAYPAVESIFDVDNIASVGEIEEQLMTLEHPCLIADKDDFERVKSLISTNPYISKWYAATEAQGDKYIRTAATVYNSSSGALSTNVDEAALTLAFLSRTCNDEKKAERYARKCVYFLNAAAEYPDFNPSKILNVGEISRGVALAYDWIYDYLTQDEREKLMYSLGDKALTPMIKSATQNSNNWNFVANGGTLLAAIAFAKADPGRSAQIIRQNVAALPLAMRMYYPDGVFIEASGYYSYASDYLGCALAGLYTAFGTDWGLSDIQGFSESGYYPIYTAGYNKNQAVCYGDGEMEAVSSPILFWLDNRFNNTDFGMYQREADNNDIFSMLWYHPERYISAPPLTTLDDARCFDGIVPFAAFMSDRADKNGLFCGIKGGFNQLSHGDLDIGNFYIGSQGESFTKELPGVNYHKPTGTLPQYFRMSRYTYYSKGPQGHNTLLINGESYPDMKFGQNLGAHCGFKDYNTTISTPYAIIDMSAAYSQDADYVYRGIMLNKSDEQIILSDKISANGASVWWFMHTDAKITVKGKTAVLEKNGATLYARISGDTDACFEIMDEKALANTPTVAEYDTDAYAGEKKLAIHMENVNDTELQVCFSTKADNFADFQPMDSWNYYFGKAHLYSEDVITVKASDDTCADETMPDMNCGSSDTVTIKYTASSKYNREAYVKFDNLPQIDTGKIKSVKMKLTAVRNYLEPRSSEILAVYPVDANWTENTLTWNNRPPAHTASVAETSVAAGINSSAIHDEAVFDITDYYIKNQNEAIAFAVKLTSRRNGSVLLAARETGAAPALEIVIHNDERYITVPDGINGALGVVSVKEGEFIKETEIIKSEQDGFYAKIRGENTDLYVWNKTTLKPLKFYISDTLKK